MTETIDTLPMAASTESTDAAMRRSILEAKRRRRLDEHQRVAAMSAPLRDPRIVEALAVAARVAHERRAEAASLRILGAKAHRKAIKALMAEARKMDEAAEGLRQAEARQHQLYGEAKDPIIRAQMRGEEVEAQEVELAEIARDEHGARIIHRRGPRKGLPVLQYERATRARKLTGVEHAFHKGYLEGHAHGPEPLYEVGLIYAEAYVIAVGGTSSQGDGAGGYGPKGPQLRIVEAGDRLQIMRKGLSARQLAVLDLVCGRDLRVREAATQLKAGFPSTVRALRGGLMACRRNWGAAQQAGMIGAEAWRVMILDAEITSALRPGR